MTGFEPLVSEATALPTEPHNHCPSIEVNCNFIWLERRLKMTPQTRFFMRDGIYRALIIKHFLPISKQTPNPSTYTECQSVKMLCCAYEKIKT